MPSPKLFARVRGIAALDQCALENWHFFIRAIDGEALTPVELQLRWRVDVTKNFEGADAVRARIAAGPATRVTCFIAPGEVKRGDAVALDGARIGTVLTAGWSSTRNDWVGWALIDVALAWPGIGRFQVGGVAVATCPPPVIDNRSLFVDPRKHTYATRDEQNFPPLVSR